MEFLYYFMLVAFIFTVGAIALDAFQDFWRGPSFVLNGHKILYTNRSFAMVQDQTSKKTFLIHKDMPTKGNHSSNKIIGHLVCNIDTLILSERINCYEKFKIEYYEKKHKMYQIALPDGANGYVEAGIINHICRLENSPKQMRLDNNLPSKETPSLIFVTDRIRTKDFNHV